jgi:hypothetical protein
VEWFSFHWAPSEIEHLHLSAFGLFLAVFSALLWATYWLITDKEKEKADATMSLFLCFFFGSLYLVAAAAVIGIHPITLQGLLSGMYVGGFEMGIPFIAFGYALGKTHESCTHQSNVLSGAVSVAVLHRHGAGRTHRGDHLCGIGTDCRRNLIQSIWRKFEVKEIIFTMNIIKYTILSLVLLCCHLPLSAKGSYTLSSPNAKLMLNVSAKGREVAYSVAYNKNVLLKDCKAGLDIQGADMNITIGTVKKRKNQGDCQVAVLPLQFLFQ